MILMAITRWCGDLVASIRWRFVLARLDRFANVSREQLISELEEARDRVLSKEANEEPLSPPIGVRLTPEQGDIFGEHDPLAPDSYRAKRIIGHCSREQMEDWLRAHGLDPAQVQWEEPADSL